MNLRLTCTDVVPLIVVYPCWQKFLVVTTNYAARQLGVPKMVAITEALAK